ncbi:hypothetical protein HDU97_008380 [Phlyctochytrium planicorne]|nr:hypothetical protein HDU97_008380 [Phlyctochytrium planicorne]
MDSNEGWNHRGNPPAGNFTAIEDLGHVYASRRKGGAGSGLPTAKRKRFSSSTGNKVPLPTSAASGSSTSTFNNSNNISSSLSLSDHAASMFGAFHFPSGSTASSSSSSATISGAMDLDDSGNGSKPLPSSTSTSSIDIHQHSSSLPKSFGMFDSIKIERRTTSPIPFAGTKRSLTSSPALQVQGKMTEDSSANRSVNASNNGDTEQPAPIPERTKRRKVGNACIACQKAHVSCEEKRPCQRCIRRNEAHLCTDAPRKSVVMAAAKAAAQAAGMALEDCASCPVVRRPLLPKMSVGDGNVDGKDGLLPCQILKQEGASKAAALASASGAPPPPPSGGGPSKCAYLPQILSGLAAKQKASGRKVQASTRQNRRSSRDDSMLGLLHGKGGAGASASPFGTSGVWPSPLSNPSTPFGTPSPFMSQQQIMDSGSHGSDFGYMSVESDPFMRSSTGEDSSVSLSLAAMLDGLNEANSVNASASASMGFGDMDMGMDSVSSQMDIEVADQVVADGASNLTSGLLLSDIQAVLGPMDATFNDLLMSLNPMETDFATLIPPCMPTENVVDLESLAEAWASTMKECDGEGSGTCQDCPVGKIKKGAKAREAESKIDAPAVAVDSPARSSSSKSSNLFCADGSAPISLRRRKQIPHREIVIEIADEEDEEKKQVGPGVALTPSHTQAQQQQPQTLQQNKSFVPPAASIPSSVPSHNSSNMITFSQYLRKTPGPIDISTPTPPPSSAAGGGAPGSSNNSSYLLSRHQFEMEASNTGAAEQVLAVVKRAESVAPPAVMPAVNAGGSVTAQSSGRFKNPFSEIRSYDYSKGYRRLHRFLSTHMSLQGRTRVLQAFARLRPAFHLLSNTRSRTASDDLASELALRTVIAEHLGQIGVRGASILNPPEHVENRGLPEISGGADGGHGHGQGHGGKASVAAVTAHAAVTATSKGEPFPPLTSPAIVIWRRTGEVVAVSQGFSDLLGVEADRLVFGAGCGPDTACGRGDPDGVGIGIHEVLTEDTAVLLYEAFAEAAVGGGEGAGAVHRCEVRDPRLGISCSFGGPDELSYPVPASALKRLAMPQQQHQMVMIKGEEGVAVEDDGEASAAFLKACLASGGPEGSAAIPRNDPVTCLLSFVVRRDFKGLPVAVVGTFVPLDDHYGRSGGGAGVGLGGENRELEDTLSMMI